MSKLSNKQVRFSDAIWFGAEKDIIVGGTGGIGSWLTVLLSRIGYGLYLFDDDIIDETNMGGQLYNADMIGKRKDEAMVEMVKAISAHNEVEALGRYTEESPTAPIVFSAFDNMAARKLMFEKWAAYDKKEIFIDGRMLAESGQIFFVTPDRIEDYRKELFDDTEVEEQPCSMKATSHCGAMIASMMVGGLTNFISNQNYKADIRDVPFFLSYEIPLLMFNTQNHGPESTEESVSSEKAGVSEPSIQADASITA